MVKGRPPLAPRIQELEKQVNTLLNILKGLSDRVRVIEERAVYKQEPYKPLFDHWPGMR